MSRLQWNNLGDRFYAAGVSRGVLYPKDSEAEAWNGLISVKESDPSSSSTTYFEGTIIRSDTVPDSYAATVEAFTYPDPIDSDLLEPWKPHFFDFSYRTEIFNDLGQVGYKIHLVYNAQFAPSEKEYSTLDSSVEIMTFSWDLTTTPIQIPGVGYSAHLVIDSSKAYDTTMLALENILYGSSDIEAHMPDFNELFAIFDDNAILRIIDNGDGTWTAIGPDEAISMLDDTTFEITWPSAIYIDDDTYKISSL